MAQGLESAVLGKLVSLRGSAQHLCSDNGPGFVSRAVLKGLTQPNIDTAHIDPGKPWQNGPNESLNGKLKDECLSMEWFRNRIEPKIVIEQFRRQSACWSLGASCDAVAMACSLVAIVAIGLL